MTTEELNVDFNWDEPLVTEAVGEGKRQFAKVRMLPVPVIPFQKGASFTLPNVHNDQYNADSKTTVRQGLKQFNGMKQGKTDKGHTIYVLVATKADREGNEYQRVKWFKSWTEKDRKNVWAELQFPALKGLDNANRAKLMGQGIHAGYDEVPTGEQATIDGKDYDTKYWTSFTVFTDEAKMKEAEKAFFAQFTDGSNGTTPALDLTNIPAGWLTGDAAKYESGVASMFKETVRQVGLLGMKGGAIKVKILNSEGQPNLNQQNQPINAVALLAKILDTPEPMIDLA
mgnify:CR=1 FL=1